MACCITFGAVGCGGGESWDAYCAQIRPSDLVTMSEDYQRIMTNRDPFTAGDVLEGTERHLVRIGARAAHVAPDSIADDWSIIAGGGGNLDEAMAAVMVKTQQECG